MSAFLSRIFNVGVIPKPLTRRLISICLLVFIGNLCRPIDSKVFGASLPLIILSAVNAVGAIGMAFSARFKNLDLFVIRNVLVLSDIFLFLGLFAFGVWGEVAIYVFLSFSIATTFMCALVAPVYSAAISEWVHVMAGKDVKEFQLSQTVYTAVTSIISALVVGIAGLFITVQQVALLACVVIACVNVYDWIITSEIIREIKSPEYVERKKKIDEA